MDRMNGEAVGFSKVSFAYGDKKGKRTEILKDLDLSIGEGEFISLVGVSGSGKSTIFRLITGLEEPASGEIRLQGKRCSNRLGMIGYMPQRDLLMPWRTVRENAALPMELKKRKQHDNQPDLDDMLTAFGLEGYGNAYPGELSGGMRQRVSFLRATMTGADILLLDEPFSALDAMTKLFMQEWLLEQWQLKKQTILFITHDISEALFLSDRVFILKETPASRLEEIKVPLGRPRSHQDAGRPEILQLKQAMIEGFRKQAMP